MSHSFATLVDLLRWRATHQPEQLAYMFLKNGEIEEGRLTYRELDMRARSVALFLQKKSSGGKCVLLLYTSELEYMTAMFGCMYAGKIAVPVYLPASAQMRQMLPMLHTVIRMTQPCLALTTSALLSLMRSLPMEIQAHQPLEWCASDAITLDCAAEWLQPELHADTLAFCQFTSGSTALPKGVMMSHGNLLANDRMIQQAFQLSSQSVIAGWLPILHNFGLVGQVLLALYVGVPCILLSPLTFLQQPLQWLLAISRYRATLCCAPNFAYELCVQRIRPEQCTALDLRCWKSAVTGAEPVNLGTIERFSALFADCGFRREAFAPCYGLTEATALISGKADGTGPTTCAVQSAPLERNKVVMATAEQAQSKILVGCGQPVKDMQVMIVDADTCLPALPDTVGEIWARGPNISAGYWQCPEETATTFHAYLACTGEGPFLRTGDMGFLQNGELFITGRLKDLIIIDGLNHYPQDIELTVGGCHPALRFDRCAAFSVEVEHQEQLVIVAEADLCDQQLQPAGGAATTLLRSVERAILRAVAEEHCMRVWAVSLLKPGSLPLTASGKIQRRACRSGFLAQTLEGWGK